MTVLQMERLILLRLSYDDCEFIYELVNEPAFKRYIGDKKISTLDDALEYLKNGPIKSYQQHGFGMFLVKTKDAGEPIGICGLMQREEFKSPDVGFAFLRRYWAQGYAIESAVALVEYGVKQLGLPRIIAIADPKNRASVRLIEKLGLGFERMVRMEGDSFDIQLYAMEAD